MLFHRSSTLHEAASLISNATGDEGRSDACNRDAPALMHVSGQVFRANQTAIQSHQKTLALEAANECGDLQQYWLSNLGHSLEYDESKPLGRGRYSCVYAGKVLPSPCAWQPPPLAMPCTGCPHDGNGARWPMHGHVLLLLLLQAAMRCACCDGAVRLPASCEKKAVIQGQSLASNIATDTLDACSVHCIDSDVATLQLPLCAYSWYHLLHATGTCMHACSSAHRTLPPFSSVSYATC